MTSKFTVMFSFLNYVLSIWKFIALLFFIICTYFVLFFFILYNKNKTYTHTKSSLLLIDSFSWMTAR